MGGRVSFAEVVRRYGRDFAADLFARSRLDHPTALKWETIALLDGLGH